MSIANVWEQEYQKRLYEISDISRFMLAVMHETLFEVQDVMTETEVLTPALIQNFAETVYSTNQDPNSSSSFFKNEDAVVRFLFRNPYTRNLMSWVAGKLLQKKTVCNKSGAYSNKVQRNDVTNEIDNAFVLFCDHCDRARYTSTKDSMFHKALLELAKPDAAKYRRPLDARHIAIIICNLLNHSYILVMLGLPILS